MRNYYAVKCNDTVIERTFATSRQRAIDEFIAGVLERREWSYFKRLGYKTIRLNEVQP